jgi:hypothetical protein
MFRFRKSAYPSRLLALTTIAALFLLEWFWLAETYHREHARFLLDIDNSFATASQKEQTYRIPVGEIIHPGDLTIQSCGPEEIRIIRQCPLPDTIRFDNSSGQSLETLIRQAFYELRKNITPLNIYCLSDLFAGELQERNILASFTIDHLNTASGAIIETTADNRSQSVAPTYSLTTPISTATSLRLNVQFTPAAIAKRMTGNVIISIALALIILTGVFLILFSRDRTKTESEPANPPAPPTGQTYKIGRYDFDPDKNELHHHNHVIRLNKKENAILRTLCEKNGNIADRHLLLNEHWGSAGLIYSRSLDTYIAKLRKYLKDDPSIQIITVKSQGYKLIY